MQCILINLDSQPDRRRRVEENFAACARGEWTLSRLSAVDTVQVTRSQTQGRISLPEKGCFLSHLVAIDKSREIPGHAMVVEDDVLFHEHSFDAIEAAVRLASQQEWDILFTDVCVPHIPSMLELFGLRRQLSASGGSCLVPLDKIVFAGSTAYIVNAGSKDKLSRVLSEGGALDNPYDLTIRHLVYNKQLKGFVAFPFPTSLSDAADDSQIQSDQSKKIADIAWNAFRRLAWLGGSPTSARDRLDRIPDSYFDTESQVFTKILGCMLSTNYVAK
jgi:GR25 family glycosyltransferase involved in LPS biosynthesis